jgi:hypothetical protein
MFSMSFYAISSFFAAMMVCGLALIIYVGSKNYSSKIFSYTIASIGVWALSIAFGYSYAGTNMVLSDFCIRSSYFLGTLIAISFFYFSITFPENYEPSPRIRNFFAFLSLPIVLFYFAKDISTLFGSTLVSEQTIMTGTYISKGHLRWSFGAYDIFFHILFFSFFSAALAVLWQKYKQQTEETLRKQALYMFWALFIGVVPAGLANAALPGVGIFDYFWPGIMGVFGWVCVMSYTIIKQSQLSIKTVTNELLVVAITLIILIGMFV